MASSQARSLHHMEVTVLEPSLTRYDAPSARALIVMLHGGKGRSGQVVDSRSASWRRCLSMQRAISGDAHAASVGTVLLRYRHRGWNGGTGPVEDARWALQQVRRDHGDLPVVLLGHSMGARTAIHVADDPSVVGVVALAPWFPAGERVEGLRGKKLVAAHGRHDHITSYRATSAFVERAEAVTTSAELHDMGPVGHYMLRRIHRWNDLALGSSLAML